MGGKELERLDLLIKESEDAIHRLDNIQKTRYNVPLLQRLQRHVKKNTHQFINVLLSGVVLAVALGRLTQKNMHETEKAELESEQRRLESEKAAVEQQAQALMSSTEAMVAELEKAVEGKGRDLPAFVRQQLADWRQHVAGAAVQPPAAAAAGSGGSGSSGNDGGSGGSGSGGGGSKIMI